MNVCHRGEEQTRANGERARASEQRCLLAERKRNEHLIQVKTKTVAAVAENAYSHISAIDRGSNRHAATHGKENSAGYTKVFAAFSMRLCGRLLCDLTRLGAMKSDVCRRCCYRARFCVSFCSFQTLRCRQAATVADVACAVSVCTIRLVFFRMLPVESKSQLIQLEERSGGERMAQAAAAAAAGVPSTGYGIRQRENARKLKQSLTTVRYHKRFSP